MMFASGGNGGDYDPDEFDQYDDVDDQEPRSERRPRATRSSRANAADATNETTGGRPRTTQFQPEERYWTDYLRIALPVVGLLLLIGLLWFWADRIINDDPNTTEPVATEDIGLVTTSTPTAPPAETESTPPPIDLGNLASTTEATEPAGDNQANNQPQETPPPADASPTEPPADTGSAFASGDTVTVTEAVNLRPNPSTEGDVLEVLDANTTLTITGGPEEGESYVWWEVVTADGETGWIAEGDYLELAQ